VIRALLDTSAVIAPGEALPLQPDDTAAISVLTVGELHAGVRLARDPETRALRLARLDSVRRVFDPLPVDETIATHYGELLAVARTEQRTTKATDLLIIATASATGRRLVTFDDAQASLARLVGVSVAP
jgi:toxin FitB